MTKHIVSTSLILKWVHCSLFSVCVCSAMANVSNGQERQDPADALEVIDRAVDYDRKWALIVGVNYQRARDVRKLKNAESDAIAVRDLLRDSYGFDCDLLIGDEPKSEASRAKITARLTRYEREVRENDCFLFYFAGHGESRDNMPVLFPTDVESDGEVANTLPAYELIRKQIKARHSLYIFDSCYSGDIVNLPFNNAKRRQGEPKFESRSIQIMTSSANNQTAKDGVDGRSPFATYLAEGFLQQKTDRISVSTLHTYISRRLEGQESQLASFIPDVDASSGGEFFFIGNRPAPLVSRAFFQTLGGSPDTLAGSPVSRDWFEETPWLTPALRLCLDDDFLGKALPSSPIAKLLSTSPTFNSRLELVNLAKAYVESDTTMDQPISEICTLLMGLPSATEKTELINNAISVMTRRSANVSGEDLHTMALLEIARMKCVEVAASEGGHEQIEELFEKALAAYERDRRTALQSRCLADKAQWLLVSQKYDDAIAAYESAIAKIDGAIDGPRACVELYAGAAYACRQSAKNRVAGSPFDRADVETLWSKARSHYSDLGRLCDELELSRDDAVRAYLHERLAWLSMDVWDIQEAESQFTKAISLRENQNIELSDFICYANSKQGAAMVKQWSGGSGKEDLRKTWTMVSDRLNQNPADSKSRSVLYSRLCNNIERYGDCDFVPERQRLLSAVVPYRTGLDFCEKWLLTAETPSDKREIRTQRLRFLAKIAIASAACGKSEICQKTCLQMKNESLAVEYKNRFVTLLVNFAELFSEYSELTRNGVGSIDCQNSINAIRDLRNRFGAVNLDRETTELLLLISDVVGKEQQRQDARVLFALLPKQPNGSPPQKMSLRIREQYDRVVMMQGTSYSGKLSSWSEFESYCDLILKIQGVEWTPQEKAGPLMLFYFPIDGSPGLVVLSSGLENENVELIELGIGWRSFDKIDDSLYRRLERFVQSYPAFKLGWADDKMLIGSGFPINTSPFTR